MMQFRKRKSGQDIGRKQTKQNKKSLYLIYKKLS